MMPNGAVVHKMMNHIVMWVVGEKMSVIIAGFANNYVMMPENLEGTFIIETCMI